MAASAACLKVKRSTKFFCFVMYFVETKLSAWIHVELVSYNVFGFSRPEICYLIISKSFTRKVNGISKYISIQWYRWASIKFESQ